MEERNQLGIGPNLVEATAVLYTGRGYLLETGARAAPDTGGEGDEIGARRELDRAYQAASAYAIGASYYALVDPAVARIVFDAAARLYYALGAWFAAIPAICAGNDRILESLRDRVRGIDARELLPNEVLAVTLLALGVRRAGTSSEDLLEGLQRFRGLAVGSARLPLHLFLSLRGGQADRARLFQRWRERVDEAQSQDYRWRTLSTSFLPLDPEILAAARVVTEFDRGSYGESNEPPHLEGLARLPLAVAGLMIDAVPPASSEDDVVAKLMRRGEDDFTAEPTPAE